MGLELFRARARTRDRKRAGFARARDIGLDRTGTVDFVLVDRQVLTPGGLLRTSPPRDTAELRTGREVGNPENEGIQLIALRSWQSWKGSHQ